MQRNAANPTVNPLYRQVVLRLESPLCVQNPSVAESRSLVRSSTWQTPCTIRSQDAIIPKEEGRRGSVQTPLLGCWIIILDLSFSSVLPEYQGRGTICTWTRLLARMTRWRRKIAIREITCGNRQCLYMRSSPFACLSVELRFQLKDNHEICYQKFGCGGCPFLGTCCACHQAMGHLGGSSSWHHHRGVKLISKCFWMKLI